MSKYVDLIGWDDAPHLNPPFVGPEVLDELESGMLPHQRQARRTGRPALGAGAIYPVNEKDIFVPDMEIPPHWERGYGMDPGWNCTAAIWGAKDPDSQVIYLYSEHYVGEQEPILHAHSIKNRGKWITGAIDPNAGTNLRDGTKIRLEYEDDLGLNLVSGENAVAAGLLVCLVRFQEGKLKAFDSLPNFKTELRLYRRDEKGKIVKVNDHLMDAMRYLVNTDGVFSTKPRETAKAGSGGEW